MAERPERPSRFYQEILSRALGEPPLALGFVGIPDPAPSSVDSSELLGDGIAAVGQLLSQAGVSSPALSTTELLSGAAWRGSRPHLPSPGSEAVHGRLGADLLASLEATTESYRRLDRQLGAANVFDDSARHLQRIIELKDAHAPWRERPWVDETREAPSR